MTDEEINIAIAEACGWKMIRKDYQFASGLTNQGHFGWVGIPPCNQSGMEAKSEWEEVGLHRFWVIQNYTTDLNAMREAEAFIYKKLDAKWPERYNEYLRNITSLSHNPLEYNYTWHATARQRAEALLKSIDK